MTKSYSEKLKDPRWQERRLRIMERDKFCCKLCSNKKSTLNVHHKYYIRGRDPWDYDDDMLTTLCEQCHDWVENLNRRAAKVMCEGNNEFFALNSLVSILENSSKEGATSPDSISSINSILQRCGSELADPIAQICEFVFLEIDTYKSTILRLKQELQNQRPHDDQQPNPNPAQPVH